MEPAIRALVAGAALFGLAIWYALWATPRINAWVVRKRTPDVVLRFQKRTKDRVIQPEPLAEQKKRAWR